MHSVVHITPLSSTAGVLNQPVVDMLTGGIFGINGIYRACELTAFLCKARMNSKETIISIGVDCKT